MGQPLAKEESSLLAEGIEEGLQQLDDCVVEKLEDLVDVGDWGKEWVCTFLQDGTTRRRRARLFCAENLLYSVVVQGASNERYEYWKGMMEWVMLTVFQYNGRYEPVDCVGQRISACLSVWTDNGARHLQDCPLAAL